MLTHKTKLFIQNLAGWVVSLVMFASIAAYFYAGYAGYPLYQSIRFVFLAIIANSIGILLLANLSVVNKTLKNHLYFFLGLFLTIFLILGFLKNSLSSINEAYLALAFATLISTSLVVYFQSNEAKIKLYIASGLLFTFLMLSVVSLFIQSEVGLSIQKYQSIFSITALVGLLATFQKTRDLIKKYLKVDFSSTSSIVALVLFILLFGFSIYILLVFQSLGGFFEYASKGFSNFISPAIAVYQLLFFVGISLVGVGWLTRRSFQQVLQRLGLVVPQKKDLFLIAGGIVLLLLANFLTERIGSALGLVDLTREAENNKLIFQSFNSIGKVAILAVAAGIGEEILFRGAIQPKFGIILTTLVFTLIHGQYQIFGLVSVFILGLILAYLRKLTNTTSTIVAHFFYDLVGLIFIFM